MGTALTGNTISSSYLGLIKTTDSAAISSSAKVITDGAGNDSPLYLSTSRLGIGITPTSTLHVSGDFTLTGAFKDTSGDAGSSGQILSSTATGTNWIDNDVGDITSVVAGDGLTGGGTSGDVTINWESTGTTGKIPKFTSTTVVGDSIVSESSSTLLIDPTAGGSHVSNIALTLLGVSGQSYQIYQYATGTNQDAGINLIPTGTGYGRINGSTNGLELGVNGGNEIVITVNTATITDELKVSGTAPNISFYDTAVTKNIANILGNVDSAGTNGGKLEFQTVADSGASYITALAIDDSQQVGIGTTTPSTLLNLESSSTSAFLIANRTNAVDGTKNLIDFKLDASDDNSYSAGSIGVEAEGTWSSTAGSRDGSIIFRPSLNGTDTTAVTITSAGNVCVGSTDSGVSGSIDLSVGLAGTTTGGITLWSTTVGSHSLGFGDATGGTARYEGYIEYDHDDDSMEIATNHTVAMRIDTSQNVGIGTIETSPNSADKYLSIGGAIQDCSIILKDAVETWEIYQNDDLFFTFGTTPTTVMTMKRQEVSGTTLASVGIGTTEVYTPAVGSGGAVLNLSNTGLAIKNDVVGSNDNWSVIKNTGTTSSANLVFVTGLGTAMTLAHNMNVGIGTTNPTAILEIAGGSLSSGTVTNLGISTALTTGRGGTTFDSGSLTSISTRGDGTSIELMAGSSATYYTGISATANSASLFKGSLRFITAGTEKMSIDENGNVGIGATSASYKLRVLTDATLENGIYLSAGDSSSNHALYVENEAGTAALFTVRGDGEIKMGTSTALGSGLLTVASNNNQGIAIGYGSGTNEYRRLYHHSSGLYFESSTNQAYLSAAGAWTDASDISIKKDIVEIKYGLDDVLKTKPRSYKMKSDDEVQIGFVAQEIKEIIPEVVTDVKDKPLGVSYGKLVAVAFKAIQELKAEIDELKKK